MPKRLEKNMRHVELPSSDQFKTLEDIAKYFDEKESKSKNVKAYAAADAFRHAAKLLRHIGGFK